MSNGTKVKKRDGRIESLDLDKMHLMVEEACNGLAGVSASQVEMTSGIQFYDGITTAEIQEILIRSASDLIDLDHPNYQYVAARLLLFAVRKQLYGKMKELPTLEQHIYQCVNHEVYDNDVFNKYSQEEIAKVNSFIDHDRDYLFTYAGLRQVVDKYLVQDRSGGGVYETPQFMYMMIALTIFAEYPKETRLSYVKKYYDAISKHKINIPTPIMAGVRTPLRQFASCVLVDVDDTLDSIFSSDSSSFDKWSIYAWDKTSRTWSKTRSQGFDVNPFFFKESRTSIVKGRQILLVKRKGTQCSLCCLNLFRVNRFIVRSGKVPRLPIFIRS